MARKVAPKTSAPQKAPKAVPAKAVASTAVRNSAIPKTATASAPKTITYEMIAVRAYEISRSGNAGSELDNWFNAERQLRGV